MKNSLNRLIIKFDTAEGRSRGLKIGWEKLLKLKHKEKRNEKKNKTTFKKCGILLKGVK